MILTIGLIIAVYVIGRQFQMVIQAAMIENKEFFGLRTPLHRMTAFTIISAGICGVLVLLTLVMLVNSGVDTAADDLDERFARRLARLTDCTTDVWVSPGPANHRC